jgi:two-component system, HptB-dependent secretion and biofilm response regulator
MGAPCCARCSRTGSGAATVRWWWRCSRAEWKLLARLRQYRRLGEGVRALRSQHAELQQLRDAAEEEERVASHLISRLENHDPVASKLMRAWVSPAAQFSGDIVAVARSPDDRVNVLLADGTGHGLAAAISVLPVGEVFSRMTERGFDVAAMASEMNRKVRASMSADRFVACVLVSIDMRNRTIEVWNGGCPAVRLLDADGVVARTFASRHLALGIVGGDDFDASVELHSYTGACELLLVSDGLLEAPAHLGDECFGDARLIECAHGPSAGRLQRIVNSLLRFTGAAPLPDDASVAVVDCLEAPPEVDKEMRLASDSGPDSGWSFELRLGAAQLRRLAVVPFVNGILDQGGVPVRSRSDVFCVLSELVSNAIDYGVLELPPALRTSVPDGHEQFRCARAARLAELADGWLHVRVAFVPDRGAGVLDLMVEDSGRGFDVQRDVATAASIEHPHAERGLRLVRALCSELHFESGGRRIVARMTL